MRMKMKGRMEKNWLKINKMKKNKKKYLQKKM